MAVPTESAHRLPAPRRARVARVRVTLLAATAALFASLLAVPQSASAVTAVPTRTKAEVTMILAVLHELNNERKVHKLPALTLDDDLLLSARRHDLAMAKANIMSHQLPGEAFFAVRMTAAGYHWSWAGENIAWNSRQNTAGVLQVQRLMYNEKAPYDGHRQNILSTHFRNVGVDVYVDHTHHKVWLTTDFGRR